MTAPATKQRPATPERRRPYQPPRLERLGDVRRITLGGVSPGVGDSVPFTRV